MAETSYIIQNGKMMYVKDASARKSIGSCGNLKTETKHCLVDAINELNDKVGGGGGGGENGATFTPSVSPGGDLSWTNDKGLENPETVNIKGPAGENGVSCTHSWDGTTLIVTSVSGTSSADLKGEKGEDGAALTDLAELGITATVSELNVLHGGITESKISHGATDHWENTLPPFTGIKVSRSRANRFALMPAEKVLVERSTDAGATWTEDTNFADADKVNLLTNAVANDTLRIMNNLSANERLRITLIAPSNSRTRINQIYTDISTRGHGVRVDIEGALNSAPNTFSVLGNNVRLGGWNGPNVINIPEITWGPSSSSDYGKIRITYKISAVSSSQTGKAIVLAIKGYGPYAFYMHSNLAFDDCLYEVNHNGDATFPANLTAKTIAGVSPTEIGYLAGATGNVQEQLNKIRETQTSGAEAMTEATIRAICT